MGNYRLIKNTEVPSDYAPKAAVYDKSDYDEDAYDEEEGEGEEEEGEGYDCEADEG